MLALPGTDQTASDFARYTGYSQLADRRRFVVAYPTATGARPSWNISGTAAGKPDDVAYLRSVIGAALKATCADPRRVGVTGVSNGGGMSARMACDAVRSRQRGRPGRRRLRQPARLPPRPARGDHGDPRHGRSRRAVRGQGHGRLRRRAALPQAVATARQLPRRCACAGRRRRASTSCAGRTCSGATAVVHERIHDAEHGWPGTNDVTGRSGFSSTAQTWAFLSAYRR